MNGREGKTIGWILLAIVSAVIGCVLCRPTSPSPGPVAKVGDKTFDSVAGAFTCAIQENAPVEMLTNAPASPSFELPKEATIKVKSGAFSLPEIVAPNGYKIERRDGGGVSVFQASKLLPIRDVLDDLRVIWSYERNYSYDLRHAATSMDELGDGTAIGKNGHVLKPALWKARIEAGNSGEPVAYSLSDGGRGFYRFAIFPILSDSGEKERFAAVLAALPSVPDADDVCFIALCGPANLTNDFSFDKAWPVFLVRAEKAVMDQILGLAEAPQTLSSLTERLVSGDLSTFVVQRNSGWYVNDNP